MHDELVMLKQDCECEQILSKVVRAKVRWLHSRRRALAHRTPARIGAGDQHRALACRRGVSVSGAVPSSAARRQPMLEQLEAAAAHGIEATHFAARGKRWVRAAGTVSGVHFAAGCRASAARQLMRSMRTLRRRLDELAPSSR